MRDTVQKLIDDSTAQGRPKDDLRLTTEGTERRFSNFAGCSYPSRSSQTRRTRDRAHEWSTRENEWPGPGEGMAPGCPIPGEGDVLNSLGLDLLDRRQSPLGLLLLKES